MLIGLTFKACVKGPLNEHLAAISVFVGDITAWNSQGVRSIRLKYIVNVDVQYIV